MIERAIAILQQAGFDLTATELADIFWLAIQMETLPEPSPQQITKPLKELPQIDEPQNQPVDISKPEVTQPPVNLDQEPTAPITLLPPPPEKPSTTENTEAIPIKIPAATALRDSLALGRALRPLMRKVPSATEKILDEEATVQRFAEDKIGIPVLKNTPERWLELALVIEETSITEIWQETIREFQRLLKYHGAFRDVRTWKLKISENVTEASTQPKIQLFPQNTTGFDESTPYKPDVLIDPKNRRLILLVSDCVSPIWRRKLIYPVLDLWGKRSLITILQLLPEKLWDRTALGYETPVLLSSFIPGVNNSLLNVQLWDEDDIDEFTDKDKSKILNSLISVPIITLEPEPLRIWSRVIAGQGNISTAGFKFSSHQITENIDNSSLTTSQLSASELVNLFRVNASLQARRLAGLMAAVPVSISVVHLIQETLLPQSTQIHVAEVFMSGLLKRLPVSHQGDIEYISYEFVDGVRELLRDFVPPDKQISVLDEVSDFIAKRLGLSVRDFEAQILRYDGNNSLETQIRYFAQLKAQVLRQLGGKYALEAEKLEEVNKTSQFRQFFQEYAGEYSCSVKWGGENGIWHEELEPEHLLISQQGEVQFSSRFGLAVIQNLKVDGETISWSFDDNQTAANITFQVDSEDSYFWEDNQIGKLFQGWLNYPNEGRIDFRGSFVIPDFPLIQEFTFEVATISIDDEIETHPFYFEVATIELLKLGRTKVKRNRQQAQFFIEDLGNKVQLEMVAIPEGSFLMGSPEDELGRSSRESPQHRVTVPKFFMGKYPVTQAQWQAVASLPQINGELDPNPSRFKGANRPVEQVSWYDAVEFCSRLSQYTRKPYSLPSEAEWEYACRAGTTTPFHFGETITSELANYDANYTYGGGVKGTYREETRVVGRFRVANAFGLYDMHGNVWEWCLDDCHNSYEGAPTDGSAWFDENNNLSQKQGRAVLRGGSCFINPDYCRSASRGFNNRDYRYGSIGFRLVCAAGRILQ